MKIVMYFLYVLAVISTKLWTMKIVNKHETAIIKLLKKPKMPYVSKV